MMYKYRARDAQVYVWHESNHLYPLFYLFIWFCDIYVRVSKVNQIKTNQMKQFINNSSKYIFPVRYSYDIIQPPK